MWVAWDEKTNGQRDLLPLEKPLLALEQRFHYHIRAVGKIIPYSRKI